MAQLQCASDDTAIASNSLSQQMTVITLQPGTCLTWSHGEGKD